MKLTKPQAEEIRYQLSIVAYEEDELREDYGLTEAQADELVKSVPVRGDWEIPAWGLEVVRDRCEIVAEIAYSNSRLLIDREYRQARRMMREFDSLAEKLMRFD